MLKPISGMGQKNKAEALYLREDRPPFRRAYFEENCDIGDEPLDCSCISWMSWMQEKWGYNASKVSMEEVVEFLGEFLSLNNMPKWMKIELETEGTKEKLRGYFSALPHELLLDRRVSNSAKIIYAFYHKYCPEKFLNKQPKTFVSKQTLADATGWTTQHIYNLSKELELAGWIERIARKGTSSITILLEYPKE